MTERNKDRVQSYSLAATISMIVGIVIGSGIYFRADDIVSYTNGNLALGLFALALGAMCIVFGSLTLSQLSKRHISSGGLVAYFEKYISKEVATGFGWFQLYIWMPSISVVVGWAAALYTFMLFSYEASLLEQVILGLIYNFFFIYINYMSRNFGGFIQRLTTAIKLVPLVAIAFYGLFIAKPISNEFISNSSFAREVSNPSWLTALVPLAFSYDGWTIAMTIAPEVINPKKNMVKALIISPIIILLVYLVYIYGITNILGYEAILNLGDSAVFEAGKIIFGEKLGNLLLVIVVISVLGVVNGINLAAIRMPQALAGKSMIRDAGLSRIDPKRQLSIRSILYFMGLEAIWTILHYIVIKYNLFNGRDVSEISIVFSYISYILLYSVVFKMLKEEKAGIALIVPILASLGSIIILVGSIIASPLYITIFIVICSLVMYIGYLYGKNNKSDTVED